MCLSSVDAKPKRKCGIGYKVLDKQGMHYLSWDFSPKAGTVYVMGDWIKDESSGMVGFAAAQYPVGFHLVLSKPDLNGDFTHCREGRNLVTVKCRFRKVVATGYDASYGDVVVSREMILLNEL